jgi:site-specific DNA-cytosine methylase
MSLALDLCCGLGGWSKGLIAAGWECVGVDLMDFSAQYPGAFIQADLLTWEGWRELRPRLVVASTPCEEFSRHDMPWTRARNPPEPSLALFYRANEIARALGVPIIQENVRGAQKWLGRSRYNVGPFHLWGDVPALMPVAFRKQKKEKFSSSRRAQRAEIPLELSRWIGTVFLA